MFYMKWLPTICLILAVSASPQFSFGSSEKHEIAVRVSHGWARQQDGSIRDVSGLIFPGTIERVEARPISRHTLIQNVVNRQLKSTPFGRLMAGLARPPLGGGPTMDGDGGPPSPGSGPTIYQADAGEPYGYIDPNEFDDPSSLDDLSTSGGANMPWENLQFGFNVENVPAFVFINWKGFSTFNSGAPAGQSAFGGMFTNFAVLFLASDVPGPGSWKLTINVAAAGAVSPTSQMYVSQQFWKDNERNFEPAYRTIYNTQGQPTIGSSLDQFWFDWDPQNNVFQNEEVDVLNEGFSNHLRTMTVNGSQETLSALIYTVIRGRDPIGDVLSVAASDDDYASLRPALLSSPGNPPIQMEFQSISSGTTANNFKFKVEAGTANGGSTQRISLWNYVTGQYEHLDTRPATAADSEVIVEVVSNAARFIAPASSATPRRVRALVSFTPGQLSSAAWRGRVDKVSWVIVR